MDMYNFPEQGHTNAYMIQHTDQYQGMYSEGGPEFVVDNQGVYYPTHTNYGYISRVYESGIDWDEQHRVFGVDTGNVQTVYYTTPPSYGHTQSLYNPYNPYIPGAILGVDNTSFMNGQQYYTVPTYDNNPAYFSNPVNPFIDNSTPTPAFVPASSTQSNSFSNTKQPLKQRNVSSTSYPTQNEAKNTVVDKLQPKFFYGKITDDVKSSPQDPRKNQLIVKAYTSRAGDVDEKGNITIDTDEYNRDDFVVDFVNAKFFVIKSYSEDDVHKSIKYNVWSSTPNGNKKLNNAYEDAQRITTGCPIFLFFSVNASGQFCGVAEMNGSVDFHKDMDFWQQDKWSGSFPVKWHIIKDVPNPNFRHIILENNENKPVTNSRDTQEIRQRKGIEVLKIFKGYKPRTSLLDDFMYYENRQKILQEEKAKLLIKNFGSSFVVPVLDPPRKLQSYLNLSSNENEKKQCNDDDVTFKIGSLTINPKPKHSQGASSVAKSSEFLTIGTIPISPRALHHD